MEWPFSPIRPRRVALILCLAAATAAWAEAWEALRPRLHNHSAQTWTVGFENLVEGWRWGYTFQPGPGESAAEPVAFDPREKVNLPSGRTLVLFLDKPTPTPGPGSALLTLRDHAGQQGYLRVRLSVDAAGADSRIQQTWREFGTPHLPGRQLLLLSSRALVITELEASLPEAAETKAEAPAETKAELLPPLGSADREAGWDRPTAFYTMNERRTGWEDHVELSGDHFNFVLHGKGNLLREEILSDFFANTLFSYNTKRFTGWEPGLNYEQIPRLEHFDGNFTTWVWRLCNPPGVHLMDEPTPGGDFKAFLLYKDALETAMAAFRQNEPLARLGIAYFRQKIVTEKLQRAVQAQAGEPARAEAAAKVMYAHDKLAAEFQNMVFHWMKEGYAAFVAKYWQASAEDKPAAGDFLAGFVPAFVRQPHYAKIMAALGRDSVPVAHAGDVKL